MSLDLASAIARFGADARSKLANPAAHGEPEDQLRAPIERLLKDLAQLCGLPPSTVDAVGESSIADLKTRPDYAVTVRDVLVGYIEVKAPGKGADPRRFKGHDKLQWEKLQSLPNLIYTDGNEFSLWRSGEPDGSVVRLAGDVETSGADLKAPPGLLGVFESFLRWEPIPPRNAKQLAVIAARLCRLLREEVIEQMALGSPALTALAGDWRKVLFPEASDDEFADGYAQAVTFGMLMARAREVRLGDGLDRAAKELGRSNSLIGGALRLLTDDAENQRTLATSLGALSRVLDSVHWPAIGKDRPDAWLYFYEDFLDVYDKDLRRRTGSYYTPPEVVAAMVGMVDDVLQSRFALPEGLASRQVTLADPAVGTGTFPLGILRRIADRVGADEGPGAVPAAVEAALGRLIGFELQLGPFAVAQLRILAELADLTGAVPTGSLRLYVADTLADPYVEDAWMPSIVEPVAESRRAANRIKRTEPITVVIGNPPYKEKAKGRGGWVESGAANTDGGAPLAAWMPPPEWGVGAHAKHLRNLYVYFWRWATWKVFDRGPGVVCFITVAGFLNGPGFERMRDYLRRVADDIWVVDCSPEGHQPEVNTRIFEGVQQPVCIVLASRSPGAKPGPAAPAKVRFLALPEGHRRDKFAALAGLKLDSAAWRDCPTEGRAPFLPRSTGAWATYPALEDLFLYNGSGVMPGRTWVIAPDEASLRDRWRKLIDAPADRKEALFHPHLRNGEPGDKHSKKVVAKGLPGHEARPTPIADERGDCLPPVRYGFRSFDRQWIIPDNRLINQPNPTLWEHHSGRQVYLTALAKVSPSAGPGLTFTGSIPDLDHYKGSFGGRVFPLWADRDAERPNIPPGLLAALGRRYQAEVGPEDLMAYIAAVASHPGYTSRFAADLVRPGLRIPLTADGATFAEAAELGRAVIWLQAFGERFADSDRDRPARAPRLPAGEAPRISKEGAIPQAPEAMPDALTYDPIARRLGVGSGSVDGVSPEVWAYEVSGKNVLRQWFSYRKKARDRPIIGDRRPPSKLGEIQPDRWIAEYTTELLNLLNVLGRLVALEPAQAGLLEKVCDGPMISEADLMAEGAPAGPGAGGTGRTRGRSDPPSLFE